MVAEIWASVISSFVDQLVALIVVFLCNMARYIKANMLWMLFVQKHFFGK